MAKPFDATLKELVETYPRDWLEQLDLPAEGKLELLDADVSTVSAGADKVLRIGTEAPYLLHLEFQASRDTTLPRRVLKYNVLVHDRHELVVRSVVILPRPEAEEPGLTGVYTYGTEEDGSTTVRYRITRVWEWSVNELMAGGLGTLPLAPISGVPPTDLPAVIRKMEERLDAVLPRPGVTRDGMPPRDPRQSLARQHLGAKRPPGGPAGAPFRHLGARDPLRRFINSAARFWVTQSHSDIMRRTVSPARMRHLAQVVENEDELPELVRQAKERMPEPARG